MLMSRRIRRTAKAVYWIAALVLCCFSAVMLVRANQPVAQTATRPATGDPEATGSVGPAPMRWCGAAPWCR